MTSLLDANVLIALVVNDHVHHASAEAWFSGLADGFATCPVTQGSLIRLLVREGQTADAANFHVKNVDAFVVNRSHDVSKIHHAFVERHGLARFASDGQALVICVAGLFDPIL